MASAELGFWDDLDSSFMDPVSMLTPPNLFESGNLFSNESLDTTLPTLLSDPTHSSPEAAPLDISAVTTPATSTCSQPCFPESTGTTTPTTVTATTAMRASNLETPPIDSAASPSTPPSLNPAITLIAASPSELGPPSPSPGMAATAPASSIAPWRGGSFLDANCPLRRRVKVTITPSTSRKRTSSAAGIGAGASSSAPCAKRARPQKLQSVLRFARAGDPLRPPPPAASPAMAAAASVPVRRSRSRASMAAVSKAVRAAKVAAAAANAGVMRARRAQRLGAPNAPSALPASLKQRVAAISKPSSVVQAVLNGQPVPPPLPAPPPIETLELLPPALDAVQAAAAAYRDMLGNGEPEALNDIELTADFDFVSNLLE